MSIAQPLLSICIPAYNRPQWLKRTLLSVLTQPLPGVEIIVSDDSNLKDCGEIAQSLLQSWAGSSLYYHNPTRLGMAANWNQSLRLASGTYVLVLHDDDFLLPNALELIVKNLLSKPKVILFGVRVVDEQEKSIKTQKWRRSIYFAPKEALIKLISNSSLVRFPALVFEKNLLNKSGYFDENIGEIADLALWIRLFSSWGFTTSPDITAAYTVHQQALTTGMFNPEIIAKLTNLLAEVASLEILTQSQLDRCKADFFHQFILAGTYRQIKQKNWDAARQTLGLFTLPALKNLSNSPKWYLLRQIFTWLLKNPKNI